MNGHEYRILVIDDERDQLDAMTLAFSDYDITATAEPHDGLARLRAERFDILIVDYRMPGLAGDRLLLELKKTGKLPYTILLTAFAETGLLEKLLNERLIADYVEKPLNLKKLKSALDKAMAECTGRSAREREIAGLRDRCDYYETEFALEEQIAGSAGLTAAHDAAVRAAGFNSTVLITGETGTGKEVFAHLIHSKSAQKGSAFIPINCTTLSESLFESELFGTAKGAYTGAVDKPGKIELAHGGTLFLDEIGDMKTEIQVKFLRVIEERRVCRLGSNTMRPADFRLIAATSRNLDTMMTHGQFRTDLFHRINVFPIALPPLRMRKEDIPALVDFFLAKLSRSLRIRSNGITPDALPLLVEYDWPGNVRELRNIIERALLLAGDGGDITADIVKPLSRASGVRLTGSPDTAHSIIDDILARRLDFNDVETVILRTILDDHCNGSVAVAHQKTGIPMSRFYRLRNKEYGSSPA